MCAVPPHRALVSEFLVFFIECTLQMFTRVTRDVVKIVALRLDVHKIMRSGGAVFIDELSHDVLLSWVLIDNQVQDLMFQAHVKQVVEVNIVDVALCKRAIVVLTSRSMLSRLCRSRMYWWRRWARWRSFQLWRCRDERLMFRLRGRRWRCYMQELQADVEVRDLEVDVERPLRLWWHA